MRILITAANGAMAKETIKHLIRDGYTDILMAVRLYYIPSVGKIESDKKNT